MVGRIQISVARGGGTRIVLGQEDDRIGPHEIQYILYWQVTAKTVRSRPRHWAKRMAMLAHCVNPNCGVPLHSFAEGRLYQFEVVSISISASDESGGPFDERPSTQTAQFWLCLRCATSFRLVLDPASGLKILPIEIDSAELNDLPLSGVHLREANNC
jgi:hypothetical protein